ncbi:hypothetical protein K501DRAFT_330199 [Backusella circina FSU 941]|nr:hypothetical protein K501DRAFT_330199 [Backusella circina FSU 941]
MSIDKHFFWVLQDEDINNEELFFPPDTPIGSINLIKSKNKIKKRHERQLKRLEEQQLQELCRFQKKFSERYDHQVYQNPAPPSCEFINGIDFLNQFGADLASLINIDVDSLQTKENNSEELTDDNRRLDSKSMIEARKLDYSLAFRRRFRSGFEYIENNHNQQFERLKAIQTEELSNLDDSTSNKSVKEKEAVEVSLKRIRDLEREKLEKERKHKQQRLQQQLPEQQQQQLQQQPQQKQQQQMPQNKLDKNKNKIWNKNQTPSSPPLSPPQPNGPSQMEPGKYKNKVKFGNVISTPLRGPPPVISSPSNRSHQGVPTIALSKFTPNNRLKGNTSQPNAPLFNSGKAKKTYNSAVLSETGTIVIKSKPNRVVIKSKNLGDPKDYADAIHGYKRTTENPVTKRFYQGKQHLFYKNAVGEIVNVGPVTEIEPLVSHFLLFS